MLTGIEEISDVLGCSSIFLSRFLRKDGLLTSLRSGKKRGCPVQLPPTLLPHLILRLIRFRFTQREALLRTLAHNALEAAYSAKNLQTKNSIRASGNDHGKEHVQIRRCQDTSTHYQALRSRELQACRRKTSWCRAWDTLTVAGRRK